MGTFFMGERLEVGWRFLLLWLVVTNVAFTLGLVIEQVLFGTVVVYLAAILMSIAQAWVLDRHIPIAVLWIISTIVGWIIGILATTTILTSSVPDLQPIILIIISSSVGGLVSGVMQWLVLREWIPQIKWWWIIVAMLSWQGIVSGLVLMRYIERFDNFIEKMDTKELEENG